MATVMMAAAVVLGLAGAPDQAALAQGATAVFTGQHTDTGAGFRPIVAPAPEEHRKFGDVLILDHGDNVRAFPSGIFWSILAVKGRLPSGEIIFVYEHFAEVGQPVPPTSGRCLIEATRTSWTGGTVWGENDIPAQPRDRAPEPASIWMIDHFDCSISSESPTIVPARTDAG